MTVADELDYIAGLQDFGAAIAVESENETLQAARYLAAHTLRREARKLRERIA